jgi:hypothetical protein
MKLVYTKVDHFGCKKQRQPKLFLSTTRIKKFSLSSLKPETKNKKNKVLYQLNFQKLKATKCY